MKIYFAGSIRGGRADIDMYSKLIGHIKKYGKVLTEHVGDKTITQLGENRNPDHQIYQRDLNWILSSDVIVAEVSTPSLGVGYEIAKAIETKKKDFVPLQAS